MKKWSSYGGGRLIGGRLERFYCTPCLRPYVMHSDSNVYLLQYSHIRIKRGGYISRGWSYKNPKNANGVGLYKVNSLHIKRGWPYKKRKRGGPFNTELRVMSLKKAFWTWD